MIEYTKEEESLLDQMIVEALGISVRTNVNGALQLYVGQSPLAAYKNQKITISEATTETIAESARETRMKIKAMSLEDMPTLINCEDPLIRMTAMWRLRIGK